MKKNTWMLIALISVIFVSGAASGFFAGRLTAPKRSRKHHKLSRSKKERKTKFQQYIYKRLKLNDEQKQSAKIIIDAWLDEMVKLRKLHAPQYLAIYNKFYVKISPILSQKQKEELNKLQDKFKNKDKKISVTAPSLIKKGNNNAAK